MDDDVTIEHEDSMVLLWIARVAIVAILAALSLIAIVTLEVISDVRDELRHDQRIVITEVTEPVEEELGA